MSSDWSVHDDALLREAVEAGATLHALAAGLVKFSKPFTLEQLTQRWWTLLYDPHAGIAAAHRLHGVQSQPQAGTSGADLQSLLRAWRARRRTAGGTGDAAVRGVEDAPTLSEVEDFLFEGGPGLELGQLGTECSHRAATRQARHRDTAVLASLERSVRASSDRAMGNALAVLRGMKARFLLTKPEVLLGRCTDDQHVDIDLSLEGNASKVSRQHAFISQRKDGTFCVRNVGRRPLTVNGATVDIGQRVRLPHDSVLEIGGLRLMFIANRRRRQQPAAGPHTPIPQGVPHVQPQPPAAEAQP